MSKRLTVREVVRVRDMISDQMVRLRDIGRDYDKLKEKVNTSETYQMASMEQLQRTIERATGLAGHQLDNETERLETLHISLGKVLDLINEGRQDEAEDLARFNMEMIETPYPPPIEKG